MVQHTILGADGLDRRRFLDQAGRQVLRYPSVHLRCLAVCDVDARAAKEEQPDPPAVWQCCNEVSDCSAALPLG